MKVLYKSVLVGVAATALIGTLPVKAAHSTFYNLGVLAPSPYNFSSPAAMTPDGTVVAGSSTNSDGIHIWQEAFRWTEAGGMQGLGVLGILSSGDRSSYAYAMSADGRVILGESLNTNGVIWWSEAFRWTQASGIQGLGVLGVFTSGRRNSIANLISLDGSVIAGDSSNSNGVNNWTEAFRWTEAGGMQGLGVLGVSSNGSRDSYAYAMSSDGSVIAGRSMGEPFRWTETGGMQGLGLDGFNSGNGYDTLMSKDGSVIAGVRYTPGNREAYRWTEAGGMQGLGVLGAHTSGYSSSDVELISSDGSVIVGYSSNSNGVTDWSEAYRWTETGGIQGLGSIAILPNGDRYSFALAMSLDGRVIAGHSGNFNGVAYWAEAFRWTETGGMQGLGVLGTHTNGDRFSAAHLISSNGSVIVGQSSNSDGVNDYYEAFRWSVDDGLQSVAHWIGPSVDLTGIRLIIVSQISADGTILTGEMTNDSGVSVTTYWARVGGLLEPGVLAASLDAMLPLGAATAASGSSALDNISEIAAHHRCGGSNEETVCFFATGSTGDWNDDIGNQESPTGTFGVSTSIGPGWRLGLGALFSRGKIDGLAYNTTHDIDNDGAGVFVSFEAPDGGLSFETSLIATRLGADIERGYLNGAAIDVSEGHSSGTTLGAQMRAGWLMPLTGQLSVTPFATVSHMQIDINRFTETSGPFPARFDKKSQTSTRTRLGGEFNLHVFEDLSLWAAGAWAHRFEDHATGISGEVHGIGPFAIDSSPLERDWAEGVFGLEFTPLAGVMLTASVTGRSTSGDVPEVEARIALSVQR